MVSSNRTCLLLETSLPERAKKSDVGFPYKEGKHLPNSIEEDVGSFSLHPTYSKKQLRKIHRMKMNALQRNSGRMQLCTRLMEEQS